MGEERKFSNLFYKTRIILAPKPDKDTKRKETYKPVSLMIIDVNILNSALANQIYSTLKGLYIMIK